MSRLPQQIGSLSLQKQLGIGRHTQVWEAVDTATGERVAVKAVVPEMARDAEQRQQLRHEMNVAQSLDHPGVIRVTRYATVGGIPHLVMELYPHTNLKQQSSAGRDSILPRLQRIATQAAAALDHMHGRGWVHRDVKPTNVLATPDGDAKVIDLAIAARKAGMLQRLLGGRQKPQGTLSYMAPEQILGMPADPRSDIYSLGCVLFELLAGMLPFTAASTNELRTKHLTGAVPAVETHNQNVTKELSQLLRQMLAKQPGDRPASMRVVIQQLGAIRFFNRTKA